MNKQEVINKLQSSLYPETSISSWDEGYNTGITQAIHTVTELDELDKEVVPQFVADWYEDNQDDFEFNLYRLCVDYENCELDTEMMIWFRDKHNKPIQTLTSMHQAGYVVKKEKLYTVEIPNPNSAGGKLVLSKQQSTGRLILEMLNSDINKPKYLHLTEDEIKKDFGWAWQFAEEVKELNEQTRIN